MQENIDLDTVSTQLVGMAGTFPRRAKLAHRTPVRRTRAGKRTHSLLIDRSFVIVDAQNKMNEHLVLRFKVRDPSITLFRIELDNQLDKAVEALECVNVDQQIFIAMADPRVVRRWYNANRYWNGETKQLPMRVFMGDGGHAACQTIWVMMSPASPADSRPHRPRPLHWLLDGPC